MADIQEKPYNISHLGEAIDFIGSEVTLEE
jgi:hypothetical protein